ncbi:PilZ domain-containing protein [Pseudomonas sp. BGr12]|uniref:PilZ domain-containing protein n=1 Tax=unclassified Pseudomonas TaxID=196821 RepID=UPI00177C94C5|nr:MULTISPECIES: PilZ domain-containing protein [unclassified Pseudomonas]MBD9502328.1 PilZ domain-containing protein [Pseudomonas sp. PDM17]MBD9577192.1 PilZ domain-containing protein [Pseudomonas sp. PDM23]MBD9671235.1 PilZ domain-containing protein [Pseudomonas sp. PDM21]MDL2428982.1 PilZ domain-containing protein [Pseudomonas sp. BJa5]
MRKHRRLTFRHIGQINVTNRLSGDPMGVVLDVSMGGLRLVTEEPLAPGSCYDMRLEIPVREDHTRSVDITAICQWSKKDAKTARFEQGFKLDRPSAAFTELVTSMSVSFNRSLLGRARLS